MSPEVHSLPSLQAVPSSIGFRTHVPSTQLTVLQAGSTSIAASHSFELEQLVSGITNVSVGTVFPSDPPASVMLSSVGSVGASGQAHMRGHMNANSQILE